MVMRTIWMSFILIFGIFSSCVVTGNDDFDKDPITFELNKKSGAKDKNGVIVIPPIYRNVLLFRGGISRARIDKKIGYIDQTGNVVIPFEYDNGLNVSIGLVGVCRDGKCGYLDVKGNVIIPFMYKNIDYFREDQGGLAIVEGEKGWGVIDVTGREIVEPILSNSPSISEGFIIGFKGKRDGIIYDIKGNEVIPLKYDQIAFNVWAGKYLNDNLFTVAIDGKWGFIDKAGKVIIPLQYDKRAFFFNGYAELVRDGKVYRVDKFGKEELIGDWKRPIP